MDNFVKIGDLLKSKRESLNIPLEDIAKKTRININILKYLEENNLDRLPNKTYIRGFVKNYARVLGINQLESLECMEKTYNKINGHTAEETKVVSDVKESTPIQTSAEPSLDLEEVYSSIKPYIVKVINKKVIGSLVAIAVLFSIGKGISNLNKNAKEKKKSQKSKKIAKVSAPIKNKNQNIFKSEKTEELRNETIVAKNDKEIVKKEIKDEPAKAEPVKIEAQNIEKTENKKIEVTEIKEPQVKPLLKADFFPFMKFHRASTNIYTRLKDAEENRDNDIYPKKIRKSNNLDKQNVYINATGGDTWLTYQVDNGVIKRFVLKQGRTLFLKGDQVLLFMGNINVAKIFYNKTLIDTKSKTGVKSLIFPQESAKDFHLPLFPIGKDGKTYTSKEYMDKMKKEDSTITKD